MSAAVAPLSLRPSLYSSVADQPREDLLRAYRDFLAERDGTLDADRHFTRREAWMRESEGWQARYEGSVDEEAFNRAYASYGEVKNLSLPVLALLNFVKANAGEAYGVEVVNRVRHKREATDLFGEVERILGHEETYHTRILVGAARQFGLEVKGAWKPSLPLKVLIGSLAYAPGVFFHPILLASEITGVFLFQWMLQRVGEIFRDQPALRESMEQRLVEILVDEVGHVAFNRLAVGPTGLAVARRMAPGVLQGVAGTTKEYAALGLDANAMAALNTFDIHHLPEEVLRRAYFV